MSSEIVFPGVGLLLFALGWPLAARRVRPNRWYGLRVPATFANERVWYDANALAGRDLMVFGVVVTIVAAALPHLVQVPGSAYAGICAALIGIGSLVLTVRAWRSANRMSRERRHEGSAEGV